MQREKREKKLMKKKLGIICRFVKYFQNVVCEICEVAYMIHTRIYIIIKPN